MIWSRTGAVTRRTFVNDAALAAAAAWGLPGGLGARGGLLAQPRPSVPRSPAALETGRNRAFNMICLGDSVMWGQGLLESTKFTSLIATWLESMLPGRSVDRFVYARSGATLVPDEEVRDESHVKPWMNNRALGEVPCSWPWVRQQVSAARADLPGRRLTPDDVDLVLLDGGINDIGITTLLNPDQSPDQIRAQSVVFCGSVMLGVLTQVRDSFPRAKILVTGYFPIVSAQSDLGALAVFLSFLLLWQGPSVTDAIKSKLATLSDAWYAASNADLAGAVAALNSRSGGASGSSSSSSPAAFAMIPWAVEHSYAASSSRLYLAGPPHDPVFWQRQSACATAGKPGPLCFDAKIGHPNTSGAAAYAEACQSQLRPYLPGWGAKVIRACVEMEPMPAPGVETTLTVHATTDGPTGRTTLPATVRVGGRTFPTGTPVTLTPCTNGGCEPITVSAPGYLDAVVRDYLQAQPVP